MTARRPPRPLAPDHWQRLRLDVAHHLAACVRHLASAEAALASAPWSRLQVFTERSLDDLAAERTAR